MFLFFTLIALLIFTEAKYSPRVDITNDGDVILWWWRTEKNFTPVKRRTFKILFNITK